MPQDLSAEDLTRIFMEPSVNLASEHHHVAPWTYLYTGDERDDYFDKDAMHFAVHEGTGQDITIMFDPDAPMSLDDFRRWVELGCCPWCYQNGHGVSWTPELLKERHDARMAMFADHMAMRSERVFDRPFWAVFVMSLFVAWGVIHAVTILLR